MGKLLYKVKRIIRGTHGYTPNHSDVYKRLTLNEIIRYVLRWITK